MLNSRSRIRTGLLGAATLISLMALPVVPASAGQAQPTVVGHSRILFLSADKKNAVLVPLPGVAKADYDPDTDARALGIVVPVAELGTSSGVLSQSRRISAVGGGGAAASNAGGGHKVKTASTMSASNTIWTCPSGGSCANTQARFSTTVTATSCGNCNATISFDPGSSHSDWWGLNPYNATSMALSDVWRVSGIAISVSFPWGAGISGSGDQAQWSASVANTYLIDHNFNGIVFSSCCLIYGPYESATATSQFGSQFWTTTAYQQG